MEVVSGEFSDLGDHIWIRILLLGYAGTVAISIGPLNLVGGSFDCGSRIRRIPIAKVNREDPVHFHNSCQIKFFDLWNRLIQIGGAHILLLVIELGERLPILSLSWIF